MIRELRKMRAKGGKQRALANYISMLQHRGIIPLIYSAKGFAAYNTSDYAEYRKTVKYGRPKKEESIKKENVNE